MISAKSCFKMSVPVMMAYIPLGIAFGILASSNDFTFWQIIGISFFVYSGSAEFLLVAFIVAKESLLGIFISLFLLGFRHFFYTLSLLDMIKGLNFLRFYLIFALSDESFALLSTQRENLKAIDDKMKRSLLAVFICLLNQSYWLIGSALGVLAQNKFKFDYSGIEFSLIALFIVLSYDAFKLNPNKKILFLAIIVGFFACVFISKEYMLFSALLFALFVLILGKPYVR